VVVLVVLLTLVVACLVGFLPVPALEMLEQGPGKDAIVRVGERGIANTPRTDAPETTE